MGDDTDEDESRLPQLSQTGARLGQLHQREDPLLHTGAARGRDDHQRKTQFHRSPGSPRDLLPHGRSHAAPKEGKIKNGQNHLPSIDFNQTRADSLQHAGLRLGGLYAIGIFL